MLEREVKLGAGPAFHLPDLAGVIEGVAVAPPETVRMETVYYDTPDLRLARWGVSLRRRAGEGWTLKLAPPPSTPGKSGAVLERDELTFQGSATKPPEAALEVVRAYVRKAELVPVARLSTVRRRVRLVDATGTRVAEVVDDEVSVRDPEAVHQARVATRKLRSNLRTFGPLLDPEWTEPLRSELGWLAMGLGAVRDREVLLERLRERAKSLPASDQRSAASLLQLLEGEIDELRKKLLADLGSQRYIDLLERLVAASHSPQTLPDADQPAAAVLPALATTPWRRLRSAVRGLPETPTDPELHRIRILAKRARYAAEAMAPVAGPAAAAFARAAAKLQTILGEHQDSVTAQAWLRSAKASGKRAFVAGELIALEGLAAHEARSKWRKVWNLV